MISKVLVMLPRKDVTTIKGSNGRRARIRTPRNSTGRTVTVRYTAPSAIPGKVGSRVKNFLCQKQGYQKLG